MRGQSFGVTVQAFNTGPEPMTLDAVTLNVPAGWTAALQNGQPATLAYNQSATLAYSVTVGPNARYSQPFWKVQPGVDRYDLDVPEHQTLPWSPPDVTATLNYTAAGAAASTTSPAYYRYDGPWVGGQKEKVVNIVPVLSVKLTPDIAVVPVMAGGQPREFRVTVANNAKTGASVQVRLETPAGLDGATGVGDAHLRRRGRRSHVAVLRHASGEAAAGRHRNQGRRRRATASRTARATR